MSVKYSSRRFLGNIVSNFMLTVNSRLNLLLLEGIPLPHVTSMAMESLFWFFCCTNLRNVGCCNFSHRRLAWATTVAHRWRTDCAFLQNTAALSISPWSTVLVPPPNVINETAVDLASIRRSIGDYARLITVIPLGHIPRVQSLQAYARTHPRGETLPVFYTSGARLSTGLGYWAMTL